MHPAHARRRPARRPNHRALLRWTPLLTALVLAACGGGQGVETDTSVGNGQPDNPRRILAAATASGGGVMINEVIAGNWHGAKDEDGDAEDWIELYNPGTSAVDLSGYGLSNKAASPFLWVFPSGTQVAAKGYLTVWLSKKDRAPAGGALHANFNLDSGADGVFLSASNATATGILVDSVTPPLLRADQSWCRMPSGVATSPFQACDTPSKGAANAGTANAAILAKPVLSVGSGFYGSAQTVSVTGPAGATLRYTTDGSEPTATSTAYSAPITVSASTVLRVAAFATGSAPSLVETGTYVIDAALAGKYTGLKAMMVALSPSDLAAFSANDQTRDFRASFEFITGGTTSVFKMDAEGSAGGQLGSGDSPQRTMNVKAQDAFGAKSFPGVLWSDKPGVKSVKKFRLRNGSNDWAAAHLRDQLSQKLGADGPNLVASATSVAMFINGKYYGLMDLREREEETLPSSNLGIDKDWVDYLYDPLLGAQEIKNGGAAALAGYQAMHSFVTGNDMTVAANYAKAKTLLNPESLAWDWALHMFHANYDWPHRNVHVWRSPEVDGRWTWHAHDMDFAFGRYTGVGYNMNGSFSASGSQVIASLLKNAEFRNLYLNTVADQINIMSPAYMATTLDTMAAEMRPYIADFYAKNNLGPASNWETRLAEVRSWINQREPIYDGHNRTQFGLGARQPLTVAVNDLSMGSVKVNQVPTQKYMTAAAPSWTGRYYPGIPVTLEARPKPGYAFVGWQGASTATTPRITQTLTTPTTTFPADNFSVRWSGSVEAPVSGTATLQTVADDGTRVWFDGQLVINNWVAQSATPKSATVNLVAGTRHSLVVEYYEQGGDASARLEWQLPGSNALVVVPTERLYPQGAPAGGVGTGLSAQYYANATLAGTPAFTQTEAINANWGTAAPAPSASTVQLTAVFAPTGAPAAPTITAVAAQAWRTGDIVSLAIGAIDPGGYDLSYSAKTLPKGLNINPANGRIYGRLTTPGTYKTTISVTNGVSTGTTTIDWTVADRPGSGLLGTSPDSGPPANVAPTVALTSPTAGASLTQGSAVTLTASAADSDGSVAKVEFFDGTTLIGSATAAPYSVSWSGATLGSHSLTARATDNAGAVTTSAAVSVSVTAAPNQAPTVALSAPATGASFTPGTTITVTASAADADGSIAKVDFLDGSSVIGTATAAPYSISWTGAAAGNHTLTARATDDAGAVTTSAPVTVSVGTPVNQAPTVALTAPAANASLVQNTAATLSASAADADGTVVRVDFYDGTTLVGSATAAPFSASWTPTTTGAHTLTARATDNAGAVTTSAAVAVSVAAPAVTPPATAVACANENQVCALPAGAVATVWYGAGSSWTQRTGLSGNVACDNATFGDPLVGTAKACRYVVTSTTPTPPTGTGTGLIGRYYASNNLTGAVKLQRTEAVNFNWGLGSPGTGVPSDNFSARWVGQLEAPATGSYQLQTNSDDGVRVWVDGRLVINNWTVHSAKLDTAAAMTLQAGQRVNLVIEYQEVTGYTAMQLRWLTPGATAFVAVPAQRLYPVEVAGSVLKGQYYASAAFTGAPALTRDELPGIELGAGAAPVAGFGTSGWAVRWDGQLRPTQTGTWTLRTTQFADDGVRVWVGGTLVIDNWNAPAATQRSAALALTAGTATPIRIEFRDISASARLVLDWQLPGSTAWVPSAPGLLTVN